MKKTTLIELLQYACRAPSGDNVQPWRFVWNGKKLSIYNISGVHNPHLDFEERGAYIAHGALIENLIIAAPHYGYEMEFILFPDAKQPELVAECSFKSCKPRDEEMFFDIGKRVTNRHPYKIRELTKNEEYLLNKSVKGIPNVILRIAHTRENIQKLASSASSVECLMLDDSEMTKDLFSGMVWTEKENQNKRAGFFIKTMEFNPVQHFIFWLASKQKIMWFLRKIGLPRFVAKQDAVLYATSAGIGGIILSDESAETFISAGRALERFWLMSTHLGLAFQPLIGMTFIAYKSETGRYSLKKLQTIQMQEALKQAKESLGVTKGILAMLFRFGDAPKPSVRTLRLEPNIKFI